MARLVGVEVPNDKRADIALTYIHGIGKTTAQKILQIVNISPEKKINTLSEQELSRLAKLIEDNYKVEGELRQEVYRNIKRLKDIKSYRGIRHRLGLPVRGQRTRNNAVTRKGRNIAVGGLKRKLEKT